MTQTITERILSEIHSDEVLEFAKDLVRIPSFTTEETAVARFLHDFFLARGFESELQEVDPGRFQTIALLRGSGGGRSLMFNGHIDIDPLPGGWRRDPWVPSIEGDEFYGAGIYNMKGGDAAMIMAAVAAKRAGVPLRGDVIVACVVGELQGGVGTVHMLKRGIRADMAIVPEPYSTSNIVTKHTGVMQLAINVTGKSAHISRRHQGINAISKMAKVVVALETLELHGERDPELPALPLVNVGTILGGRGPECEPRGANMVPDHCSVYLDIRFPRSMTPASVVADIRAVLERVRDTDKDLVYEIEMPMKPERQSCREVMLPTTLPNDHPLVQMLKANVTAIMGKEPAVGVVIPGSYAGNDTAHLYAAGIPCCLYGPAGGYSPSSSDRWTSVSQIMTCARVFGATIADVCA